MPHATLPSSGLQAFILCGPGVSLNTFTSSPKDLSKALIPVANRPMVWYPLDWCYRSGINNITLITPQESEPALVSALKIHPALTSLPSPKPETVAPAALTQTEGTAEIFRLPEVQQKITSDFVVLACDLVSEVDGTKVVQQWLTLNPLSGPASETKGGLAVFYPTQGLENISHKKDETDFIGSVPMRSSVVPPPNDSIRLNIEQLVLSMPTDTLKDKLEEGKDTLLVRQQLLQAYGRVKLKTKHRDAHVYVFPQWVKKFITSNERFESLSEDVVGWWAKSQWQPGLTNKLHFNEILQPSFDVNDEDEVDAATLSSTKATKHSASLASSTTEFASRVGLTSSIEALPSTVTIPPLLAYIQPSPSPAITTPTPSHPLIRRVDNTHSLLGVSLYLARQPPTHPLAPEHKIHPSASVGAQSRVAQEDSLIAENVKIGTRCVIKESVVGANCDIGNNVRLTRCLLMEGVVIGDGVTLTGCIIGRRAKLEGLKAQASELGGAVTGPEADGTESKKARGKAKAKDDDDDRTKLTDCEVAPNFVVEAGTEAKGEKMMPFDTEGDVEAFAEDDDDELDDNEIDDE